MTVSEPHNLARPHLRHPHPSHDQASYTAAATRGTPSIEAAFGGMHMHRPPPPRRRACSQCGRRMSISDDSLLLSRSQIHADADRLLVSEGQLVTFFVFEAVGWHGCVVTANEGADRVTSGKRSCVHMRTHAYTATKKSVSIESGHQSTAAQPALTRTHPTHCHSKAI